MTDKKPTDYTEDLSFDWKHPDAPAMFTPSMSRNYVGYTSGYATKMPDTRAPKGLHRDGRELNFLKPDNACWYYPNALSSAGHANLNFERDNVDESEGMVINRDRSKGIIVGDSGGYQIGKGILKFDWKNFESDDNNKLRLKILKWLEHVADVSMTLDVPTWGIGGGLEGVDTFDDCLEKTLWNHDFFIKNRTPGATRFLNILHGRNLAEADIWWDTMKDLPFEGWALAGINISNFETIMRRLIIMRDGGYLDKERNWLHFLGVSRLASACAFSQIQRSIRKHVEPEFTISFDASSPFLSTAKGRMYSKLTYSPKAMSYTMDSAIDNKDLAGSDLPFPFQTPIGKKLVMGDLNVKGHNWTDKHGKPSKSAWDSWTYMFMMNHNCYMHTRGIVEANRLYSLPKPHIQEFIPAPLIEFKDLCEEIFTTAKPMDLIKKHATMLQNLAGVKSDQRSKMDAFKTSGLFALEGEDAPLSFGIENDHIFDDSELDGI